MHLHYTLWPTVREKGVILISSTLQMPLYWGEKTKTLLSAETPRVLLVRIKATPWEYPASTPCKHSYPGSAPGGAVSSIQLLFPLFFPSFLSAVVVAQLLCFCIIFKAAYHIFTKGNIQNGNLKKFITSVNQQIVIISNKATLYFCLLSSRLICI